jgi:hypothetical protein
MFLKTNIPETTSCLTGRGIDFRDSHSLNTSILYDQANTLQVQKPLVARGNHCGHLPSEPRFYHRPLNHKQRPSVLEKAIKALEGAYYLPKKFLKSFVYLNASRRKRSERREAVASVSQVLLHYLELSTLQVGFYNAAHQFVRLDLKYIAQKAGITALRAKRALADLAKAGYLTISRQFAQKNDGTFKGRASIRKIAIAFFVDLGIDVQRLFFAREWKRKTHDKSLAKQAKKKLQGMLKAAGAAGRLLPSVFRSHGHQRLNPSIQKTQTLISLALEHHRLNPECSPSDYLKKLQRLKE